MSGFRGEGWSPGRPDAESLLSFNGA